MDDEPVTTAITKAIGRNFLLAGLTLFCVVVASWLATFFFGIDRKPGTSDEVLVSLGAVLLVVLGVSAASLVLFGSARSMTNFDKFWRRVETVLQSGIFYFFAGLALLFYAIHASNVKEHPSLTFLVAMLGFAIMLFGTGSQAAGALATGGARLPPGSEPEESSEITSSYGPIAEADEATRAVAKAAKEGASKPTDAEKAEALGALTTLAEAAVSAVHKVKLSTSQLGGPTTGRDWGLVKANAAIAGGAAVLAGIFGFGVITYSREIRDVFNDFDQYEIISVAACAKDGPDLLCKVDDDFNNKLNLEDYSIHIESLRNAGLPFSQRGRIINIVLFNSDIRDDQVVRLIASRVKSNDDDHLYSRELNVAIPLSQMSEESANRNNVDSACIPSESGPRCRLRRLAQPTKLQSRVKTTQFSLNFAPAPVIELH